MLFVEPILLRYFLDREFEFNYFGIHIKASVADPTYRKLFFGQYEKVEFRLLKRFIKPEMVIYDIGAHHGLVSIRFAELLKGRGSVYCFEPVVDNYNVLLENIRRYKYRDIFIPSNTAISSSSEPLKLGLGPLDAVSSKGSGFFSKFSKNNTVEVSAIEINSLIAQANLVDLIKLDIEGMEEEIILNLTKSNLHKIKLLIFEFAVKGGGYSKSQIETINYLQNENFDVRRKLLGISGRVTGGLTPIRLIKLLSLTLRIFNLLTRKPAVTTVNFFAWNLEHQ